MIEEIKAKFKNNWISALLTILFYIVLFYVFIFLPVRAINRWLAQEGSTENHEIQVKQEIFQEEELTSKQKEVKNYLLEIRDLGEKGRQGDMRIDQAGRQIGLDNAGMALSNVSSAQAIYESVLGKTQQLEVPIECQSIQANFIEATQTGLRGIKIMREGLEELPMDKNKMWQGLEIYGKAMLSLARTTEEILKVKEAFNLN